MAYILQKSIHLFIIVSMTFAPIQYVSEDLIEQGMMQGMIYHSMHSLDMTAIGNDNDNEHNCEHCDINKCICESDYWNCVNEPIKFLAIISKTFLISQSKSSINILSDTVLFTGLVSVPLFRPPII